VCVTGGEPTLQPDLPKFLAAIREKGYLVKLDTNGARPDVLAAVLDEGLVDYVAMDIKNGPQQYAATCGLAEMDLTTIERSIRLLTGGAVDYEFRTTVVKELHNEETITQMGNWLRNTAGSPVKRLFLQSFVDRDTVKFAGLSAPEAAEMQQFQAILAPFAEKVEIRGS
jgi:pyruvate formate lyase activating enzyme